MDGSQWRPYQEASVVTPPFAKYTSGQSTFPAAACRLFLRHLGTWASYRRRTPSSASPAGVTPQTRRGCPTGTAGIHFEDGDVAGRAVGEAVGNQAWDKAQACFGGTAG